MRCYAVIATVLKISVLAHSLLYFSISFTTVKTMLEMDYEEGFTEPESIRKNACYHFTFLQGVQST